MNGIEIFKQVLIVDAFISCTHIPSNPPCHGDATSSMVETR